MMVAAAVAGGPGNQKAVYHHMDQVVVGPVIPAETIEILDISGQLPKHPSKTYPRRDPKIVIGYVVHHTGAPPQSPVVIANYHITKKDWAGAGYHYAILRGKILILNDISVISNHTANMNTKYVGVVVIGNYEVAEVDSRDLRALEILHKHLSDSGISVMTWHRAVKNTQCPGKYLIPHLMEMKVKKGEVSLINQTLQSI